MKNVEMKITGKNTLEIIADLSKEFGVSKSGKSQIIASTEGNQSVLGAEDIKVGLNIYRPANSKPSLEGNLFPQMGSNVTASLKGNVLTMKIDTTKKLGVSKSGKSQSIGTTSGNVSIGLGEIKCGLNVYSPISA